MNTKISKGLDKISEYLSLRKGLLPIIGLVLILINLAFVLFLPQLGISRINFFLHIGLITTILGILLAPIL